MDNLTLPSFKVGMIIISPSSANPYITPEKKYIIEDVEDDWIMITDDAEDTRYYKSHLFIEVDVYYNMLMYLTLIRLFDINPNRLK